MPRRVDANQPQIVTELRQLGFLVADTHTLGHGKPDILVAGIHRKTGEWAVCWPEIKSKFGRLTEDEEAFHEQWERTFVVFVARSTEDILRWFGWNGSGAGIGG